MSCSIKDVARRAGVSVGTVSRVINGHDNVADNLVSAVKTAINELGYSKNSAARLLAGQRGFSRLRTGNIGLWMAEAGDAWSNNHTYVSYLNGVQNVCTRCGCHLILEHEVSGEQIPACVRDGKVDGLIVKALNRIPPILSELAGQIPVVGLSMNESSLSLPQVTTDNRAAGEEVCRYLWQRGHRRIGFIAIPHTHRMFADRMAGYSYFLNSMGAFDPALLRISPENNNGKPWKNFPDLRPFLSALLELAVPPTAIITANDWMAYGLCEAAREMRLRIPENLSVVGFDHLDHPFAFPRLTSWSIPMREMGETAAEWLLDLISQDRRCDCRPTFRLVNGSLIEHDSVRDCPALSEIRAFSAQ